MAGLSLSVIRTYFEIGMVLTLGGLLYKAGVLWLLHKPNREGYLTWVRLGYGVIVLSFVMPVFFSFLPKADLWKSRTQVFSSPTQSSASSFQLVQPVQVFLESAAESAQINLPQSIVWSGLSLLILSIVFLSVRHLRQRDQLLRHLRCLPKIRQLKRVRVLASETDSVAFSTWIAGTAFVVVPTPLLIQRQDLKLTLGHELQHHRQGDTFAVGVLSWIRIIYFWCPGIYLILKSIYPLQEFACDEKLIGRRQNLSHAYSGCLIRAAETLLQPQVRWVGTTPMAAVESISLLRRRIQMILYLSKAGKNAQSEKVLRVLALALLCLITGASYAAKSPFQDRTLRLDDVRIYASKVVSQEIPIEVNELVVQQLNRLVGTPQARAEVQKARRRMAGYEKMIHGFLDEAGMPRALIALAFFESRFKNLPPTPPQRGAGIWEFIEETARRFDLEVSDSNDQRLDPVEETRAAVKYLALLKNEFKDWRLVLKAYNEGEKRVRSLIDALQTQDPWVIERRSSSEGELPGVIATMILLANPELSN